MSADRDGTRHCDQCDKDIARAARVHLGKEYCGSCYRKCFAKTVCSRCGAAMRLPKGSGETPVCRACANASRTCLRCGKPTRRAGRLFGGGALCRPCSVHFRPHRPCERCGQGSPTLSTYPKYGIRIRICPRCFAADNHRTCSFCRKPRLVAEFDDLNRPICPTCAAARAAGLDVAHPCPRCGARVAGLDDSSCTRCLNRERLRRLLEAKTAILRADWTRQRWRDFVEQQTSGDSGDPGLPGDVERSFAFFRLVDSRLGPGHPPTAEEYASRIDSRVMRRFLSASRSVARSFAANEDLGAVVESTTEDRRIDASIGAIYRRPYAQLIESFDRQLREADIEKHTRRQYLRAAVDFCQAVRVEPIGPWSEHSALRYLRAKPGQRANLFRWYSFCRQSLGWQVSVPSEADIRANEVRIGKAVVNLRKALGQSRDTSANRLPTRLLARIFSRAYGLSAAFFTRQRLNSRMNQDGSVEIAPDVIVPMNHELHRYALRWLQLAGILETRHRQSLR